jgi:DNA (cytosine-5)-methyltransferase 1
MRIIEVTKPDIFIFENVKGLFGSEEGRDFEKVLQTIADLGVYECEWQLLNTSWFLPQNRERVYFIGHLRGRSRPKVFPFREGDFKHTKSLDEEQKRGSGFRGKDYAGALRAKESKSGCDTLIREVRGECLRWQNISKDGVVKDSIIPTLRSSGGSDIRKKPVVRLNVKGIAWSKSHRTGKTDADKRRKKYGEIEHRIKEDEFNTLSTGEGCGSTGEGCGSMSTQNFVKTYTTSYDLVNGKREVVVREADNSSTVKPGIGNMQHDTTLIRSGLNQTGVIGEDSEATRVYSTDGCARTIKNGGGMGVKTGLYEVKKTGKINNSQSGAIYDSNGVATTITGCGGGQGAKTGLYKIDTQIRRLTPTECERLQGFPDGWTEGLSDTQKYKCLGNAVSVPVVKAIGERLLK